MHMWVDMNEWKTLWCCHAWLTSRVVSYKYSSLVVAEWMQNIRTMLCFPDSPLILWRLSLILLMAATLNDIQRETKASSFFSVENVQFLWSYFRSLCPKIFSWSYLKKVPTFHFWNIQTETLPMALRTQGLRDFTKVTVLSHTTLWWYSAQNQPQYIGQTSFSNSQPNCLTIKTQVNLQNFERKKLRAQYDTFPDVMETVSAMEVDYILPKTKLQNLDQTPALIFWPQFSFKIC